jgi:hypothetical protein
MPIHTPLIDITTASYKDVKANTFMLGLRIVH